MTVYRADPSFRALVSDEETDAIPSFEAARAALRSQWPVPQGNEKKTPLPDNAFQGAEPIGYLYRWATKLGH